MNEGEPWWTGVPTKLIQKKEMVSEGRDRLPVYTLTFEIPSGTFSEKACKHSEIRIDMGDVVKMVIPGYKPKSYSVSDLRETEFDVTLKVYPKGRASGYLDRLRIGDTINSFGKHVSRKRNPGKYVGLIAYGVGITEALPLAKAELGKGNAEQLILLWATRTKDDWFWYDRIAELSSYFPDKFRMVHILSRENEEGALHGRIDADVIQKVFDFPVQEKEMVRFLSIGTKGMMASTDKLLTSVGYSMPLHSLLPKTK